MCLCVIVGGFSCDGVWCVVCFFVCLCVLLFKHVFTLYVICYVMLYCLLFGASVCLCGV